MLAPTEQIVITLGFASVSGPSRWRISAASLCVAPLLSSSLICLGGGCNNPSRTWRSHTCPGCPRLRWDVNIWEHTNTNTYRDMRMYVNIDVYNHSGLLLSHLI